MAVNRHPFLPAPGTGDAPRLRHRVSGDHGSCCPTRRRLSATRMG